MEQGQAIATETSPEEAQSRLLATARALVLRGDQKFSIATLCAEAEVSRTVFREYFSGKTALMAALMAEPASSAPQEEIPKAEPDPSVSTPDAWLERRLRVFERALNALEAKADASARDQARAIADMEDRLNRMGAPAERRLERRPLTVAAPEAAAAPEPEAVVEEMGETAPPQKALAPELQIAPLTIATPSREEMAEVLQSARQKARAVAEPEPEPVIPPRTRWLAVGALSLVVLFLCITLSLGKGGASAAPQSDGVAYRQAQKQTLARLTAMADAGDAGAQAKLALIYVKGDGVAADQGAALRWSRAAARSGQPVAQYLLGALYREGGALPADAAMAFQWFAAAAVKGNLKAMHNLATAYAQGLGTEKDEAKAVEWFTRAAERGYVDSAFNLAVLYERGLGVPQDLKQALTWYGIAAQLGDAPAEQRAQVLRGQISQEAVKRAATAALNFAPVPPLGAANRL
jgi:TPR repeat protein